MKQHGMTILAACLWLIALTACAVAMPGTSALTSTPRFTDTPAAAPATQPIDVSGPCAILATRTPAPSAPTYVPNDTSATPDPSAPARRVDPHVEVCASATQLKVGEMLTVFAQPVDIGLPIYSLTARDASNVEWEPLAQVSNDNQVKPLPGASAVLAFVSAQGQMRAATFVLRARAAGSVTLVVGATGEVHYGYPGPATWAGGSSAPLVIQVTQ
jgi:hypothetical protein